MLEVLVAVSLAVPADAQSLTYTDEASFLAALAAQGIRPVREDFEGATWSSFRTTAAGAHTASAVTSQGVTWTALHAVTTGDQVGRGGWAIFDHVGGDPDGLFGQSSVALQAVGGWFTTNTPFTDLAVLIDGVRADGAVLQIDTQYRFLGVIVPAGFTRFEIRDLESSSLDPRHWFADDFTFGFPATSQVRTTGVLPSVASSKGLGGSEWHSDLVIHNASASEARIDLYFAPRGRALDPASVHRVVVGSNQTLTVEDVVAGMFATQGSGALYWVVAAGDESSVLVSAFVYSQGAAGGRYGEEVPGVRWTEWAPAGAAGIVPAVAGRYRTNVGFATDDSCTRVTVHVFDRAGLPRASREIAVLPQSWVQLDDLFGRVFPELLPVPSAVGLGDSLHRVEVAGVDGQVVAYSSFIDQDTNDATTVLARSRPGESEAWLPTAALVAGQAGSQWRSDLLVLNAGAGAQNAEITFFSSGGGGSARAPYSTSVPSDGAVAFENVLSQVFGVRAPASGSLRILQPPGAKLLAWMRTYTEAGGTPASGTTYGQAVEPVVPGDAVGAGVEARLIGIGETPVTRSNLVLQNVRVGPSGELLPSTVIVDVLLADGTPAASRTYKLGPGENLQHNHFLANYGLGSVSGAALRVRLVGPLEAGSRAGVIALVTAVDGNQTPGTNDSRVIPARLLRHAG